MMHTPAAPEILAAERRFVQSKRDARESLSRAGIAFRANLTKPSTLAFVAGAAGLIGAVGFWAARRRRSKGRSPTTAKIAAIAPIAVFVRTLIMRYAKTALPFILQQFLAAGRERVSRKGIDRAEPSAANPAMNGARN